MLTIAALECSTNACSVALRCGEHVYDEFALAPRQHGDRLLPMLDRMFALAGLSLTACDAVAFGSGPGSFMGTRLAAGVAQGLAYGINKPLIPISSLQALAQEAYWVDPCARLLAGWDARMQQMYWAAFEAQDGLMQPVGESLLSCPSDLQNMIAVDRLVGNAWSIYQGELPPKILKVPQYPQDIYPTAKAIAVLAADAMACGLDCASNQFEMQYLRPAVTKLRQ